jgi:hypothetical protein
MLINAKCIISINYQQADTDNERDLFLVKRCRRLVESMKFTKLDFFNSSIFGNFLLVQVSIIERQLELIKT